MKNPLVGKDVSLMEFALHNQYHKIKREMKYHGSTSKDSNKPIPPCGSCRQALVEYEKLQNSPIELYFMGTKGEIAYSKSVENILPWLFDNKWL